MLHPNVRYSFGPIVMFRFSIVFCFAARWVLADAMLWTPNWHWNVSNRLVFGFSAGLCSSGAGMDVFLFLFICFVRVDWSRSISNKFPNEEKNKIRTHKHDSVRIATILFTHHCITNTANARALSSDGRNNVICCGTVCNNNKNRKIVCAFFFLISSPVRSTGVSDQSSNV